MKKILPIVLALFSYDAVACWTAQDKSVDNFAELDGKLVLTFKDASTCKPIAQANVKIEGKEHSTDSDGRIKIDSPAAFSMDAKIPVSVTHKDYIKLDTELRVEAGTVINKRMVMSTILPPGDMRFVLLWDDEPEDLDLHLVGRDFHISYRNMKSAGDSATLDTDELEGFGPETITLSNIKDDERYEVFVDNFSGGSYTGNEVLTVYKGSEMLHKIKLPAGDQRSIQVLEFMNKKFTIKVKS